MHQAKQLSSFESRHALPVFGVGITAKQFQEMQDRMDGTKRKAMAAPAFAPTSPTSPINQILLGVDPSLRGTGYGVIKLTGARPKALAYGAIKSPAGWERSRCLVNIAQALREVIQKHHPTLCIIEGLFFAQNLQTALIMGEARGACLATIAEAGLQIYEIAPRKVKQAIVGYGAAQKLAVAKMVQRMLDLAEAPQADAADALALALAYAQGLNHFSLGNQKRI